MIISLNDLLCYTNECGSWARDASMSGGEKRSYEFRCWTGITKTDHLDTSSSNGQSPRGNSGERNAWRLRIMKVMRHHGFPSRSDLCMYHITRQVTPFDQVKRKLDKDTSAKPTQHPQILLFFWLPSNLPKFDIENFSFSEISNDWQFGTALDLEFWNGWNLQVNARVACWCLMTSSLSLSLSSPHFVPARFGWYTERKNRQPVKRKQEASKINLIFLFPDRILRLPAYA